VLHDVRTDEHGGEVSGVEQRAYRGKHFKRPSRLRTLVELPALLVVAVLVTLLLKAVLAQAFYIPSASMEPQLHINDRVIVSRTSYRLHSVHRGDIVVFPSPTATPKHHSFLGGLVQDVLDTVALGDRSDDELIKRVIALPGEEIETRNGRVYIDGRPMYEPYLPNGVTTDSPPIPPQRVPQGRVFVMGDNRNDSHDSRFADIGPIKISSIVGRAFARIWPPGRNAFL
jgi:signal peptidase I